MTTINANDDVKRNVIFFCAILLAMAYSAYSLPLMYQDVKGIVNDGMNFSELFQSIGLGGGLLGACYYLYRMLLASQQSRTSAESNHIKAKDQTIDLLKEQLEKSETERRELLAIVKNGSNS